MKKMRNLMHVLTASGVAMAVLSTWAAQNPQLGSATVVRIQGHARYAAAGADWKPLEVGDVLRPGTLVQTDMSKGSYVDLVLNEGEGAMVTPVAFNAVGASPVSGGPSYKPASDQNVVRVAENTILGVDKLTATRTGADVVTETQLDLKKGHIFGSVKKMTAASRYEIKLPNGVAGIRGTTYEVWDNGSAKVNGGSIVVSLINPQNPAAQPETHVLSGKQSFNAESNQTSPLSDTEVNTMDRTAGELHAALGGGTGRSLISTGLNQGRPQGGASITPEGQQQIPFTPDHTYGRGTTNAPFPVPPHGPPQGPPQG